MKTLIRNGRIIDPASRLDGSADLLFEDGKIIAAGQNLDDTGAQIIDAAGMWVVPGLIDLHVHLRDPGFPHKETIATGARAAAAGGFTTICAMPNTNPVTDCAEVIAYIFRAAQKAPVSILPIGSITRGMAGQALSDISGMAGAGICALSEDGKWVDDPELFKAALAQADKLSLPVFAHCEDLRLTDNGQIHAGPTAKKLGLAGISSESESSAVARDIALAQDTGTHLHICHISVKESVEHLRAAKAGDRRVTGEVCPHHFALCDEDIPGLDANFKMSPPLRGKIDREAVIQALKDGTVEVIATDHAPHHADEKNGAFTAAPNGIVGLETAIPLCITELVETGVLTPSQLIAKLTVNPAGILGIDKGHLKPGGCADIVIIDPNCDHVIDKNNFHSLGGNTPFDGRQVRGQVIRTIVSGKTVYLRGEAHVD
ncbi:MAG: dihydroorotase [Oscillospiraceae bacterium]|nr:dihydroorotase [Oscillospiraceae bacterium]